MFSDRHNIVDVWKAVWRLRIPNMELLAHETWFTDERPPFDFGFLFEPLTLFYIALTVAAAWGWRWLARRYRTPELPQLSRLGDLAPWIPRLLGVHAGVSLIAQAYAGTYLVPSLALPSGTLGTALKLAEGVLGVWLVSGWNVKPAASLLVLSGPIGALFFGVLPIVERIDLLGIALFLVMMPPGRDDWGARRPSAQELRQALLALRLAAGGALVVLAFSEKLVRPDLALAIIEKFPFLNILRDVGIGLSDIEFIRLAGAVELLFGLLIISGAAPQLAVIVAGIPFNATLFFFGGSELVGHLPVYGVMLALLVYGSSAEYAASVPWNPWSGRDPVVEPRTPSIVS